jgi:hypothetical protein
MHIIYGSRRREISVDSYVSYSILRENDRHANNLGSDLRDPFEAATVQHALRHRADPFNPLTRKLLKFGSAKLDY